LLGFWSIAKTRIKLKAQSDAETYIDNRGLSFAYVLYWHRITMTIITISRSASVLINTRKIDPLHAFSFWMWEDVETVMVV
jgi:hypothetical protein